MNVSSVKNLNGETFSAVQDADLTTVVQTNSGNWDRISALSGYSANGWSVSNATAGQALRGETHGARGVHLSGVTTAGLSFDLSTSAVSGKNDTANNYNWKLERGCVSGKGINGEWRYGPAEDSALRTVSALPQINYVSTSSEATGTNILYVVTGTGGN